MKSNNLPSLLQRLQIGVLRQEREQGLGLDLLYPGLELLNSGWRHDRESFSSNKIDNLLSELHLVFIALDKITVT